MLLTLSARVLFITTWKQCFASLAFCFTQLLHINYTLWCPYAYINSSPSNQLPSRSCLYSFESPFNNHCLRTQFQLVPVFIQCGVSRKRQAIAVGYRAGTGLRFTLDWCILIGRARVKWDITKEKFSADARESDGNFRSAVFPLCAREFNTNCASVRSTKQ